MKPVRAAIQLTKLWRNICPNEQYYPVDCRKLAEALKIKVCSENFSNKFEAQLRIRGEYSAIIYNENIREEGRKNFCISHEIGHYSCHKSKKEYFCTSKDLNDISPHPNNIEQEANLFAATLLMPIDDFRTQIDGKELSLMMLSKLANERYKTTLTATCKRLIELSKRIPLGMAIIRNNKIVSWDKSDEMRWTGFGFKKGHPICQAALGHNLDNEMVESNVWLNEKNSPLWNLNQSSVYMPYYDQTLVLIKAERTKALGEFEEPDPTPPSIPNFK